MSFISNAPALGPNLVVNGDFNLPLPNGWSSGGSSTGVISNGQFTLLPGDRYYTSVPIDANAPYLLSYSARVLIGDLFRVIVYNNLAPITQLVNSYVAAGNGGTVYPTSFTINCQNPGVSIYLFSTSTESAVFDFVRLQRVLS